MSTLGDDLANLGRNIKEEFGKYEEGKATRTKEANSAHLEKIGDLIKGLKQQLNLQSNTLPSYTLLQNQQHIANYDKQLEALKIELNPPKKFSFRSRPSQTSTAAQPAPKPQEQTHATLTHIALSDRTTSFLNRTGETIIADSSVVGKDVLLSDLTNCVICIPFSTQALKASKLKDCTILCGPIQSSTFIDDSENTTFVIASQQIRIHTSTHCRFYIFVKSNPIIESCNNLSFAPYSFNYDALESQLKSTYNIESEQMETINKWNCVDDFNWRRATPSPNWHQLATSDRNTWSLNAQSEIVRS